MSENAHEKRKSTDLYEKSHWMTLIYAIRIIKINFQVLNHLISRVTIINFNLNNIIEIIIK